MVITRLVTSLEELKLDIIISCYYSCDYISSILPTKFQAISQSLFDLIIRIFNESNVTYVFSVCFVVFYFLIDAFV